MVAAIAGYFQQYLSHFINHSKLMARHYEPPTNLSQAWTWFKATTGL